MSKEQRRLAHAVLCSGVPLMPLPTESWCPHGVLSFVDKSTLRKSLVVSLQYLRVVGDGTARSVAGSHLWRMR